MWWGQTGPWDPNLPLLITGAPTAILTKPAQIRFHSKRPHTITKLNDNINMDNTIAGSINVRQIPPRNSS
jgi:hypothetical protein